MVDAIGIFRDSNYRWYLIGNFSSAIGIWVQRVAILWLTWELTHSTTWLGLIALAETGPTIALGLYAGVILDRFDHLAVLRFTQLLTLIYSISLFGLTLAGLMNIWLLAFLVLFRGSIFAFNRPARQTVVYRLIGRERLLAAISLNATVFQSAKFIGPALGGLSLVVLGVDWTFGIAAILIFVFTIALSFLRVAPIVRKSAADEPSIGRELSEGLSYILSHRIVRAQLFLLLVVAVGAKPITDLMPGFAANEFHRGAAGLAWLLGCHGVGASAAGLWLSFRAGIAGLVAITCASLVAMAAALILFVSLNSFVVGCVLLAIVGFSFVVMDVGNQTLIQSEIRSRYRGRTMSVYGMVANGAPALGALLMGYLAEGLGLRVPVLVGAAVVFVVGVGALFVLPGRGSPPQV